MTHGIPRREFEEYLVEPINKNGGHDGYMQQPATEFLDYAVEIKTTVQRCIQNLPTKRNGEYNLRYLSIMESLMSSVLPALVGNFETFQRHLFAGVFDRSVHLQGFSLEEFFERLNGNNKVNLGGRWLAAQRNDGVKSAGILVADSLERWDAPEKVNDYFRAFFDNVDFFDNLSVERLKTLWELRHFIIRSGGTLNLSDSKNVASLHEFGKTQMSFKKYFIFEVVRKLHVIVKESTERLSTAFVGSLLPDRSTDDVKDIDRFFSVNSKIPVWLR